MTRLNIGYAACPTDAQDLTAQRDALAALGVEPERIYVDHGLTGTNRDRPGLREALAACRAGDTLVVTKLDRLARSLPDARDIVDELTAARGQAQPRRLGARPDRPGRAAAVQRARDGRRVRIGPDHVRTREGMKVAKAKGRLRGKQPKLTPRQEAHLVALHRAGEHTIAELAELFSVTRSTVTSGKLGLQYDYRCNHCHRVARIAYTPASTIIDWTALGARIGDHDKPLPPPPWAASTVASTPTAAASRKSPTTSRQVRRSAHRSAHSLPSGRTPSSPAST